MVAHKQLAGGSNVVSKTILHCMYTAKPNCCHVGS